MEWNVRLSSVATPGLMSKFDATFDTYWNDSTFEIYDPDRDRDRLDDALADASGRKARRPRDHLSVRHWRCGPTRTRPRCWSSSRWNGWCTTGTATWSSQPRAPARPSSRRWTTAVSVDRRAAETSLCCLWRTARRSWSSRCAPTGRCWPTPRSESCTSAAPAPSAGEHVFACVQSLTSYGVTNIPSDAYDIVVIDEFHHAEAATYRRLLDHLQPKELLGLTATPERADGVDVRSFFDGRTAAELRLWDALSADLLCPFHYFGIADGIDLSAIEWKRGGLRRLGALQPVHGQRRARRDRPASSCGTRSPTSGACGRWASASRVAHAEYMARVFTSAGIPSLSVTGETRPDDRARALDDLRSGRVNVLFTADLFNEGLDLPDVDTVLFLRPTESATVFLQQLGRGLRRAQDKAVLTALDFVGHQRKEFRFDVRYRAITGATRRGLRREIEHGFPFLPSGCQIVLDEQAQDIVLENIRAQVTTRWAADRWRAAGVCQPKPRLFPPGVRARTQRRSPSGPQLDPAAAEASLPTASGGAREPELLKRVRSFAHVDDPDRAAAYLSLLSDDAPRYDALAPAAQRFARMLFFSLWPNGGGFATFADGLESLRVERAARAEMTEVIELGRDNARHVTAALPSGLSSVPLRTHARYSREEIVAALDYAHLQRLPNSFREGVLWAEASRSDAFLVTLHKSEADYSPTTMYRDYAISPTLFHWESQSARPSPRPLGSDTSTTRSRAATFCCSPASTRCTSSGTAPYLFLGPAAVCQPYRRPADRDHLEPRPSDAHGRLCRLVGRCVVLHVHGCLGKTATLSTAPPKRTIQGPPASRSPSRSGPPLRLLVRQRRRPVRPPNQVGQQVSVRVQVALGEPDSVPSPAAVVGQPVQAGVVDHRGHLLAARIRNSMLRVSRRGRNWIKLSATPFWAIPM